MTYDIICEECDTEYQIHDDDDLEIEPRYCPYCGHDHEPPLNEDPWKELLEDDDVDS